MKIAFDRRAIIFIIFASLSFLLVPVSPVDFQWVGELLSIIYLILAGLSWLDNVSRRTFRKLKK
jgi:hypothetical protein